MVCEVRRAFVTFNARAGLGNARSAGRARRLLAATLASMTRSVASANICRIRLASTGTCRVKARPGGRKDIRPSRVSPNLLRDPRGGLTRPVRRGRNTAA